MEKQELINNIGNLLNPSKALDAIENLISHSIISYNTAVSLKEKICNSKYAEKPMGQMIIPTKIMIDHFIEQHKWSVISPTRTKIHLSLTALMEPLDVHPNGAS